MAHRYLRVQLDSELCARAEAACAKTGRDLLDVLRAVVSQIAQTGAVPAGLATPESTPSTAEEAAPTSRYESDQWSALRPLVEAELALSLLDRFVAELGLRLMATRAAGASRFGEIAALEAERIDALKRRARLDLDDPAQVSDVITTYGARLRPEA